MSSLNEFGYIVIVDGSFDGYLKVYGWGIYCWNYESGNTFVSRGLLQEGMLCCTFGALTSYYMVLQIAERNIRGSVLFSFAESP